MRGRTEAGGGGIGVILRKIAVGGGGVALRGRIAVSGGEVGVILRKIEVGGGEVILRKKARSDEASWRTVIS